MRMFEGFAGITPEERYKNEMLYHERRQTELLEQIAQLLNQDKPKMGRPRKGGERIGEKS